MIDCNLFECKEYHSTFKIFEGHCQELLTDKLRIDFLNSNVEDDETLDSLATKSPAMKKAVAVLRQMSADEKTFNEVVDLNGLL